MIASITPACVASLGLAILLFSTGCKPSSTANATANSDSTAVASSKLAQEMIGTWVHVGRPGRFKYRTGTHWVVIGVEPDTGLVTENFGGTYTMNGEEYVETQGYADETWLHDNGKSFKFLVEIEGNMMTQTGVGNPYNEVWKRVKNDIGTSQPTDRN